MGVEQLAAQIREHGTAGRAVRPVGGGTKLGWGTPGPEGAVDVETGGLNEIAEHLQRTPAAVAGVLHPGPGPVRPVLQEPD